MTNHTSCVNLLALILFALAATACPSPANSPDGSSGDSTMTGAMALGSGDLDPTDESSTARTSEGASSTTGAFEGESGGESSTTGERDDMVDNATAPPLCARPRLLWPGPVPPQMGQALSGWKVGSHPTIEEPGDQLVIAELVPDGVYDAASSSAAAVALMTALASTGIDAEYECPGTQPMAGDEAVLWPRAASRALIPGLLDVTTVSELPASAPAMYIVDIGAGEAGPVAAGCVDEAKDHRCAVEAAATFACSSAGPDCASWLQFTHYNVPQRNSDAHDPTGFVSDVGLAVGEIAEALCNASDLGSGPAVVVIPLAWSVSPSLADAYFQSRVLKAQECGAIVVVAHGNVDGSQCNNELNRYPGAHAQKLGMFAVGGLGMDGELLANCRPDPPLAAPAVWWGAVPNRWSPDQVVMMVSYDPRPRALLWSGTSIGAATFAGSLALVLALTQASRAELKVALSALGTSTYSMRAVLTALTANEHEPGYAAPEQSYSASLMKAATSVWQTPAKLTRGRVARNECPYSPFLAMMVIDPIDGPDDACLEGDKWVKKQPADRPCVYCATRQGKSEPGMVQMVLNLRPDLMRALTQDAKSEPAKVRVEVRVENGEGGSWTVPIDGIEKTWSAVANAMLVGHVDADLPLTAWLHVFITDGTGTDALHVESLGRVIATEVPVTKFKPPCSPFVESNLVKL